MGERAGSDVNAADQEGVQAGSSPADPAWHNTDARYLPLSQIGENLEGFLSLKTGTTRSPDDWWTLPQD